MKIALVDDENDCLVKLRQLCGDFSIHFGYPVEMVFFTDGEAFLAAFENGGFSVVFMDIYMDGIDGIAAACKMRGMDSGCLLVFVTSSNEFMADAMKVLPQTQKYVGLANGRATVQVSLDGIVSAITGAHYLYIAMADGRTLPYVRLYSCLIPQRLLRCTRCFPLM